MFEDCGLRLFVSGVVQSEEPIYLLTGVFVEIHGIFFFTGLFVLFPGCQLTFLGAVNHASTVSTEFKIGIPDPTIFAVGVHRVVNSEAEEIPVLDEANHPRIGIVSIADAGVSQSFGSLIRQFHVGVSWMFDRALIIRSEGRTERTKKKLTDSEN